MQTFKLWEEALRSFLDLWTENAVAQLLRFCWFYKNQQQHRLSMNFWDFFYPASVAESFRWIRKRNMHWCLFQLYCTESRCTCACICVNNRAKELRQVVSFCIFKQMQTQKQNHAHQWHGAQSAEIIMRSDWIFLYLCLSCSSFVSRFSMHLYLVIWCWCFEICDTHSFEYAQQ